MAYQTSQADRRFGRSHARRGASGVSWCVWVSAVTALSACAGSATAQDSVSTNSNGGNGLPGDALSAFATGQPFQRSNYVVDLATVQGSWGTVFGIAPVMKSARVSEGRFNAVNGPSTISTTLRHLTGQSGTFVRWTTPGAGVNPTQNNIGASTTVALPGDVVQVGGAMLDFDEQAAGAGLGFVNVLSSASMHYSVSQPSRLYVTRVVTGLNAAAGSQDTSQFGLGGVEASGSVVLRADGFQALGSNALVNDNYFFVAAPSRLDGTLNTITNSGATNASTWLVVRNAVTLATPGLLPGDAGGGGGAVGFGADFAGNLLVRPVSGSTSSVTAHRPGTLDHRGSPAVSGAQLWAGTRGSGAILSRSTGGGGKTDSISVWGISTGNGIVNARTLTLPLSVVDGCDGFNWPISNGDFRQYDNQSVFRGGSAPVAVGKDRSGRGLVSATVYNGSQASGSNPFNAIVVGRFDPATPAPATWTAAAWVDAANDDGKDILGDNGLDGAPNTGDSGEGDGVVNQLDGPIGRLVPLAGGPTGFVGPSLSAPAFDSAGNVYFVASVALKRLAGNVVQEQRGIALVRALADAATACYRLEVVLPPDVIVAGQNSGRAYRVVWLGLADEDSASSASLWSGNVSSQAWGGGFADSLPGTLPSSAPQFLGGLVASARIVYDADANGLFQDPSEPGGVAGSADEAYNVMLYVGNVLPVPTGLACDSIDFNNDTSFFDPQDIEAFLSVYSEGPCVPETALCNDIDFNNDSSLFDPCDIASFLTVYAEGPCTACGQ